MQDFCDIPYSCLMTVELFPFVSWGDSRQGQCDDADHTLG